MKKLWKWLLTAGVLAALVGVLWFRAATASAVEECNRESEFLLDLTLPEKEFIDTQDMELIEGYGGYSLHHNGVSYGISGYPDVQDIYHVTNIIIESNQCAVYGIRVGDSLDDAEEKLIRWGYVRAESPLYIGVYRKHDVTIEFSADENGKIGYIKVKVDTTNKENVVF